MKRRKFMVGVGSLAAGGAAAMGTGAYKGANVEAERTVNVEFEGDTGAYLQLIPSSQFAETVSNDQGGTEGAGNPVLQVQVERLNVNANTRLNEVFEVRNTTGHEVDLTITEVPEFNGAQPDGFRIFADDGTETRIDDGGSKTIPPGNEVDINFRFTLLGDQDVNNAPQTDTLEIKADGAT